MSLTTALIFLFLPIPAGILGMLGGGSGPDAEIGWYVPFMAACCLAFFAILGFLTEVGRNPVLSPDEKRNWRLAIFFGWPIAAPLYWTRFR